MLREEIVATVAQRGVDEFKKGIFAGFQVGEEEEEALLVSLLSGHHLLIVGPPGSGKTDVARRISGILNDIEVVGGCPLNCRLTDALCPWCLDRKARGIVLKSSILPGAERVKKVQGSGGLVTEDLIGSLDPEVALKEGIYSPRAFVPGKLLRANRGILLIDFIDQAPERVLNAILCALQGDAITVGPFDYRLILDTLIISTGSERVLKSLPLDIADCFDVIRLDYIADPIPQKRIIIGNLRQSGREKGMGETMTERVVDIINRTRDHIEVKRGVSTRGMIGYAELLTALSELKDDEEGRMLREGALISLPHRLRLSPEADTPGKREGIINEIVEEATGIKEKTGGEIAALSKEDILTLVEEMVSEDAFRIPLKYGAFDLLLKRFYDLPESMLAQLYRKTLKNLQELYPERCRTDNITEELLQGYEEERKRGERLKRALEEEALMEMLKFLEERDILKQDKDGMGWGLSRQGINFLLEKLSPRSAEDSYIFGYGRHRTGKKSALGEGKVIGHRHFRFGDRYRDVSLKDTIREAIRNRREKLTREDIMVEIRDVRTRMNIVLLIDLSGTMAQLKKLWYAKQSAIALALATGRYKDGVGVVSFSNLADVVVDLSSNPHHVTQKVLDLELHENAFTNIGFGIMKACTLLAHHPKGEARQHIILISDGDATAPHPSPQRYALRQAAMARRRGITISSVCITQQSSDLELMRRIARVGKGRIYYIGAEEMASTLVSEAAAVHAVH